MKKVIHMVTISGSVGLMDGQFEYLQKKGYRMGLVSSPGEEFRNEKVDFKQSIEMARDINVIQDLKSLMNLIKYFNQEKPDLLNAGTPKAGLLGMIAAFITRVPHRIYTMRGLRLETTTGIKRRVLWITEKISCSLATEVICISPSLLEEAKKLKLLNKKGVVLKRGSSNGLDLDRYPLEENNKVKNFVKEFVSENKLKKDDFILGFVGRLTEDKGINELLDVFVELNEKDSQIKLIILGMLEQDLSEETHNLVKNHDSIFYLGYVPDTTLYYYLFDILIFPTHREGFGNVSIEAQAASVPVITTDVTGVRDTVINNKTGLLYPVKNKEKLKKSIVNLYNDESKREEFGKNGRAFVKENFQSITIWNELEKLYASYLK